MKQALLLTLFLLPMIATGTDYYDCHKCDDGNYAPIDHEHEVKGDVYNVTNVIEEVDTASFYRELESLRDEQNGAIAIAGAMAAIPGPSHAKGHPGADHVTVGAGAAAYEGESALALGLEKHTRDWAVRGQVGVSTSSDPLVAVGASRHF